MKEKKYMEVIMTEPEEEGKRCEGQRKKSSIDGRNKKMGIHPGGLIAGPVI
jgi:hypothetical protein